MRTIRVAGILLAVLFMAVGIAQADVNEFLYFNNHTDEELYIELSIDDVDGWQLLDLYVIAGGTSGADFWAIDPFAYYTVCAYGEITGDFYGCIEGSIADTFNTINFDFSGAPYRSTLTTEPLEWFVFDHPGHTTETLFIGAGGHGHGGGGCFIGALAVD